jgi:hypothetical protein
MMFLICGMLKITVGMWWDTKYLWLIITESSSSQYLTVHIELNIILLEFYLLNNTGGISSNGGEGDEHLLEVK